MQAIQFIPKDFHDVESKFNTDEEHSLTPFYPHFICGFNELAINAPKKIIISQKDSFKSLIIPLCGYCSVSHKRIAKYADQNEYLIHIKKVSEEQWVTGAIFKPAMPYNLEEIPINEEERKREIAEAQKFTDTELDEGVATAESFNVNILQFVRIIPEPGIYEIYVTKSGLESNRVQVEIVLKK